MSPKVAVVSCRSCGKETVEQLPTLEQVERAVVKLKRRQERLEKELGEVMLSLDQLSDMKAKLRRVLNG